MHISEASKATINFLPRTIAVEVPLMQEPPVAALFVVGVANQDSSVLRRVDA
jgi:hypothetical protein